MNWPSALLLSAAATLGLSVAAAQTAPAPFGNPPHKNLKIYPADMPRAELLASMKLFSQSLGVRCTHCHVGEEGKPLSTFDFASDAKRTKLTARKMLAMVQRINREDFHVTSFKDVKVTCFTCHRGQRKPLAMPPVEPAAAPAPPRAAAERG